MKFACDRCGKRYASVDEPAAGRVYRIRCRCGHAIVVRGPPSGSRAAADVHLRRFEAPPLPPPLAPEGPSSAGEPRSAPTERERTIEDAPHAVVRETAPALGTVAPTPPMKEGEPFADDDSHLRSVDAEMDTIGFAGASSSQRRPRPAAEHGEDLGAESGETLDVGVAALPAVAVRPPLSLGLDEDGASGARRRVLFAAIIALLTAAATLALSRM